MIKQMTYNQLFMIDQQIMQFEKQFPGIALLLEPRIKFFYQRAELHLKAMQAEMFDIQKKFIQQDDAGNFKTTGEGDDKDWLFVPVYTDFKSAAIVSNPGTIKKIFEEKVSEFMNITIKLDL